MFHVKHRRRGPGRLVLRDDVSRETSSRFGTIFRRESRFLQNNPMDQKIALFFQ
jgi:hypothetical protein